MFIKLKIQREIQTNARTITQWALPNNTAHTTDSKEHLYRQKGWVTMGIAMKEGLVERLNQRDSHHISMVGLFNGIVVVMIWVMTLVMIWVMV